MSTRVRLRRIGKNPKGKPHFRISVMDKRAGRDSRVIEEIGFYNPLSKETRIDIERLNHWIKQGAEVSLSIKDLAKKAAKIKA